MMYGKAGYSISISAGASTVTFCWVEALAGPLCRHANPCAGEFPARLCRSAGTLPSSLMRWASRDLDSCARAFDAIDHGTQRHITAERRAALLMQAPNRSAHLIVGITCDIFHQKVDQPGIALKDGEHLQAPRRSSELPAAASRQEEALPRIFLRIRTLQRPSREVRPGTKLRRSY